MSARDAVELAGEDDLRAMLAGVAYQTDTVRLTDASMAGCDCLVASRQGLFGVGRDGSVVKAAHGLFFGIRSFADGFLAFEACDRIYARSNKGRLVHLRRDGDRLVGARILAKGLDNQCHQIAAFDNALWVVDTANQAILQFAYDGSPIARHTPFPVAPADDTSGAYLHINSIARIGDSIALLLHNGRAEPLRPSELAWVDRSWTATSRVPLNGHSCHDIVVDDHGVLWHCDSMAGDVITSADGRIGVADRMTRGLAVTADTIVVGTSNFTSRRGREAVVGSVAFIDRATDRRTEVMLPGAPTDLVLL